MKFSVIIFLLFLPTVLLSNGNVSDIKQKIIKSSISSYRGNCPCPYNTDRAGRKCGGRSAYSRPGGASPICYESDVTDKMMENYRTLHSAKQSTSNKQTNVISGKVVNVADGDTITILNAENKQTKVRLYGIDAPEKAQDFGNKSREKLASLVAGKNIEVVVIDVDQYGRSVAELKWMAKKWLKKCLNRALHGSTPPTARYRSANIGRS